MPEKAASSRPGNAPALMASILVLIILLPLGYSVVRGVVAPGAETSEAFYELPDPKIHKSCVVDEARGIRDTRDMRLQHWELLRGIREEVVRYGKRGEIGLNKCRECHTSRKRFCYECHQAATVKPDCWGCHYYP